jgi:ribosomal protein S27E
MSDISKLAFAVAKMECPICNHEQVSVYPASCEYLECGGCGYMMEAPPLEDESEKTT